MNLLKSISSIFFSFLLCQDTIYINAFSPTVSTGYGLNDKNILILTRAYGTATDNTESGAVESEVERLLRKARELRQEAEAAEVGLHSDLIDKKCSHDQKIDAAIDQLFPSSDLKAHNGEEFYVQAVVERLREHKFSTDKLKDVVGRLHEREVAARGLQHVESKTLQAGHVFFEVVSSPDENKLHEVEGLVGTLVDAAKIIDEEYWKKKRVEGEKLKLHNSDKAHWTTGNLATILGEKVGFLGREHSEQFKKRMAEYYEAARKKDDPKDSQQKKP